MPNKKELSAIDIICDQINNVLGDTNGEQMLCLTIPGTILDKKTFEYDSRFEKPLKVAANESRLANKLFDVTKVTGSDNGRQLATYKVNQANTVGGTFQSAFYYMYGEYIKEKQLWAEKQNEKRKELVEQYPGTSDEAQMQRQEAFLNWYQTVAEIHMTKIDEKKGQILSFLSPNDIKVIDGILSCESATALEEARENLENAKRFEPNTYEKRFQEVLIKTNMSQVDTSSSNIDVEISFLATKVSIARNWLNPTAFVIAKDVTIRFSSAEESDFAIYTAITERASKDGGFLCFSVRSLSSCSSESDSSVVTRESNGVTIKIPVPQIIGYYLQIMPEDKSTPMNNLK